MTNRYQWKAELIEVIDGDTVEAWVELDFGVKLCLKLRVAGVNAPEMWTVKHNSEEYTRGLAAKVFVQELFEKLGKSFHIESDGPQREKYGRFLVNVLMPDGNWLDQVLVKTGHAVKKAYQ